MLYGTKEDPNSHLDAATPPPPPLPEAIPKARPSSQAPQPASAPPPPISMSPRPGTPPPAPEAAARPVEQQQQQQHWSTYLPPASSPPPPPPLPAMAPTRLPGGGAGQLQANYSGLPSSGPASSSSSSTSSSSSSSISSSTQAAYDVTTFNSIASGSSSSRPTLAQGGAMKADFDIVSPASERPISSSSDQDEPTTTPAAPTKQSTSPSSPGSDSDEPNITKPPVDAVEDAQQQQHSGGAGASNRPASGQQRPSGLDLEGNQIDLKLGKDYRSSGDQTTSSSISLLGIGLNSGSAPVTSSTTSTAPGDQQLDASKAATRKQSSASGSSLQNLLELAGLKALVLAALISALLQHHHRRRHLQLDQLVRHRLSNNVI